MLFLVMVAAPVLAAAAYYLLIASPLYVSEASFVVRNPTQPQPAGFTSMLQGVGLSSGTTDAYTVHAYIMSRDAVAELGRAGLAPAAFQRPGADALSRFPRPFEHADKEQLFKAYERFVDVSYDSTTGVSTLKVKAFRPADAQAMANTLLNGGERVINQLNEQAEQDAVDLARQRVLEAQSEVSQAQAAMTGFRSRERLVDPVQSSTSNLKLVETLSAQLAGLKAERAGLAAAAPQSPQLAGLDDRIRAYQSQIDDAQAVAAGQSNSLAPKIGQYEQLVLERNFAGANLTNAMTALDTARIDAERKRLYLQRVVNPGLADAPAGPQRWRALLVVLITSLLAYGTVVLLIAGFREHRQ